MLCDQRSHRKEHVLSRLVDKLEFENNGNVCNTGYKKVSNTYFTLSMENHGLRYQQTVDDFPGRCDERPTARTERGQCSNAIVFSTLVVRFNEACIDHTCMSRLAINYKPNARVTLWLGAVSQTVFLAVEVGMGEIFGAVLPSETLGVIDRICSLPHHAAFMRTPLLC